jgi:hypothetical protein
MENYTVQQRIFMEDSYIIQESDDSVRQLAEKLSNIKSVSFEEYFGKLDIVKKIQSCFERVHNVLNPKINYTINDKERDLIRQEFEKLESLCENHFNVESVTINLVTDHNTVSSVPVSVGKIDLSGYAKYSNKEAMNEYGRIISDSNGIRFAHKEAHHIIVTLGVGILAANELTSAHVTALFFHEIGHSFIEYKTGWNIGTQRLLYITDSGVRIGFNIFMLISQVKNIFENDQINTGVKYAKFINNKWARLKNIEKTHGADLGKDRLMRMYQPLLEVIAYMGLDIKIALVTAAKTILSIISCVVSLVTGVKDTWGYIFNNQKSISAELKTAQGKLLDGSFVIGKPEDLTLVAQVFLKQIGQIFSCGFEIIVFGLPSFATQRLIKSFLFPGNYTGRKIEYSADEIASAYGLGAEISEVFKKFRDVSGNNDILTGGIFAYTNKVPVLNIVSQLPFLILMSLEDRATGHPSDRSRINNVYNTLLKELNSKTLNPKLRKAVVEDLNRVAVSYNEYIDPKLNTEENNHARAFVYYIGRFLHGFFGNDGKASASPPNPVIIRLHSIQTWMQSIDIKKMLGIKPDTDKQVLDILDGRAGAVVEQGEEYADNDYEISYESYFSDKEYEKINSASMESYFGKRPIVEDSIKHVRDLRSLLPKKDGALSNETKQKMKDILNIWAGEISNEFNVTESCIGLENIYNAYAYPMLIGNSTQFKSASEVKIIESSAGYKFEKKDNLYIIIAIGLQLLTDTKLTDETIVSIIFHEIGHGFQQYKNDSLQKQRNDMEFSSVVRSVKEFFYTLGSIQIINAGVYIFQMVRNIFTRFNLGKDRTTYIDSTNADTNKTLDDAQFKNGKIAETANNTGIINPLTSIILIFQHILGFVVSILPVPGIASFLHVIVYDPLYLLDLAVRGEYFKRKKRDEYFADAFSAAYGLGGSIAELNKHFYEKTNKDICDIPIVKVIAQFNVLGSVTIMMALDPHPTDRQRIKAAYEYLEKEVTSNKTLTPELRKNLLGDLVRIENAYNDVTLLSSNVSNGRIGQGLLWLCLGTLVKLKSSAKEAADVMAPIVANQMQVLKAGLSVFSEKKKIQNSVGLDAEEAKAAIVSSFGIDAKNI